MGSSRSSLSLVPDGQQLLQETGFSAAHLLRLHERFRFLDKHGRGHLRQEAVDFPSFVRVLAHFRPMEKNRTCAAVQPERANSRNRKLKFAFQLYDRDRDGKISRTELLQVLREMLGLQVTEEQLQSIAERGIQEADLDRDDAICFDEFRKSLEKVNIDQKMSVRFLE
ncbi:calcineurin B homologous protein 2 isoform X2 [Poeciliopsis prolifica]|uniref:calcineurin B homologous protein 2 isoform X2 n=1 Tax=Poeciliopsis prolifica TaxID=188132 RepID=UPI002413802E|nr:calcineurin B homologous protein 2 isoform X2 [Poeciliopsis prolifica]